MNLLNASIHGSIGAHTGIRTKGKNVIKAKIWSKEPPNAKQKANVRSFECLNRLSAAIAKQFWPWLDLSDRKMHRHNAVAQWLKPLIAQHVFNPAAIEELIPQGTNLRIEAFGVDVLAQELTLRVVSTLGGLPFGTQSAFVCVFDVYGRPLFATSMNTQVLDIRQNVVASVPGSYFCLMFSSTLTESGHKLADCVLFSQENPHTLYFSNLPLYNWYVTPPHTVGTNSPEVVTSAATIIIP